MRIQNAIVVTALLQSILATVAASACAQELSSSESIRTQACAAPDRLPGDKTAKAEHRLYRGIGVNAAICVAGTPDAQDRSNGGQSIDALKYSDGRELLFRNNQLESMRGTGAKPLLAPPIEDDGIDPSRRKYCTKAKVKNLFNVSVRIGDSYDRAICVLGFPSDRNDIETANVYFETLYYKASDGTLERAITIRNNKVYSIQNFN